MSVTVNDFYGDYICFRSFNYCYHNVYFLIFNALQLYPAKKNDKLTFIKNVNNLIIPNPEIYFNLCTFASNQINKKLLL